MALIRDTLCPNCVQSMAPLPLEGHYGQTVQTDICAACHLVWFDEFESVRLSGLGWVHLLRRMQAGGRAGAACSTPTMKNELDCPRCELTLKAVRNLTTFGRFAALECPRKHGHAQTYTLLLAERGLVRAMTRTDIVALSAERRSPECLHCGAPVTTGAERCTHCDSPLLVVDMPRLFKALTVRHTETLKDEALAQLSWQCRACGAALEPTHSARCDQCQHPVVVPSLLDLAPVLDTAEALLKGTRPRQALSWQERAAARRADWRDTALYRYWQYWLGGGDALQLGKIALILALLLAWQWWRWWSAR